MFTELMAYVYINIVQSNFAGYVKILTSIQFQVIRNQSCSGIGYTACDART